MHEGEICQQKLMNNKLQNTYQKVKVIVFLGTYLNKKNKVPV